MKELSQKNLEDFLEKMTGARDLFEKYEKLGIYGSKEYCFNLLKGRLGYSMGYLGIDFSTLLQRITGILRIKPKREFEEINAKLYQDEMYPIKAFIFYVVSEPFILRRIVKQEILYLAFKLQKIRTLFVAGMGSGEILENIVRVPLIRSVKDISVKGVDISQPAIDFCKKRSALYKFNIVCEAADLDFYKFSEKFDLVELSEVLEHVRKPQALLNKIANSSKLILATIPLMLNVPSHLHLFDIVKIREMVKEAKLEVVYETLRNSFYMRQIFYFALLKRP